uniref:Si:ch1073-13h15.3 n=1 Tax=Oncorhynchus mykiss TaxID=8022 RepID=A0A8K9XDM0_ONCMY
MIYPHCPIQVSTSSASSLLRIVFDQITQGQLEFVELDQHFDTIQIGEGEDKREYTIFSGKTEMEAHLKNQFPDDVTAIETFYKIMKVLSFFSSGALLLIPQWLALFLLKSGITNLCSSIYTLSGTGTFTSSSVTSSTVLGLNVLDSIVLHSRLNYTIPFHYFSIILYIFRIIFYRGAYYPKGGASEISYHIIPVIQKSGGNVLVRAPVTQILVNNDGAAYGVKVRKGQEEVEVHAPTQTKPDIQERLDMTKHGRGSLLVFSGFDGTQEELGIVSTNFWLFKKNDMDGSLVSLMHHHSRKSCMTMLTMVKYECFEEWTDTSVRKRGDDYTNYKMKFCILSLCVTLRPPPLTYMHYLGAQRGAMYSAEHNLGRFHAEAVARNHCSTPVKNLFISGQDVFSCGIAGALHGGLLCASTVLDHIVYINLLFLKKKQKDGQAG